MKKSIVVFAAAAFAFVGCSQRDQSIDESAGAQKDAIEQSTEAQADQLDQQKKQISEEAKAEKDAIEAQADAQKAQIDAQKEQLEAQAKAEKAQLDASQESAKAQADANEESAQAQAEADKDVNEAAGAANPQSSTSSANATSDDELEKQVRSALFGSADATTPTASSDKNIEVSVDNGVVTLKGSVASETEKTEMETKAKGVSGVSSVKNELEVKAE